MTITLDLQTAAESQLQTLAHARGIPPSEYAERLLLQALVEQSGLHERNTATLKVLDSFLEDDSDDQAETWQALQQGLAETRQTTRRGMP